MKEFINSILFRICWNTFGVLLLLFAWVAISLTRAQDPGGTQACVPQYFGSDSFVCVCNATYCDTTAKLTTHNLDNGTILVYTTSRDEYRLHKDTVTFAGDWAHSHGSKNKLAPEVSIDINPSVSYQEIVGFGGSFTDATGINIRSLSNGGQTKLLEAYFSDNGLQYNLGRVPIGGSDFSTRPYTYDDGADGDFELQNFTLQAEDHQYKIPVIKQAQAMSPHGIKLVATTWSPPAWMKTNNQINGRGWLKGSTGGQYYQTLAKYHIRFLEEYKQHGIGIWALTSQNEPATGLMPFYTFNCLGFTPNMLRVFVNRNLGPALRSSPFNTTKLLIYDFVRVTLLPYVLEVMGDSDAGEYADGIAVHWYTDQLVPPLVLDLVHALYPGKPMLMTEACIDSSYSRGLPPVVLGSWERAVDYAFYIIQNLQHWVTGWIDWNMALDPTGGPNWASNFVDAPIIVNGTQDEFYKQPMYYVLGHFSKFVPPGSVAIKTEQTASGSVTSVAFATPDSNAVLVVLNRNDADVSLSVRDAATGANFQTNIPGNALQTYIWKTVDRP